MFIRWGFYLAVTVVVFSCRKDSRPFYLHSDPLFAPIYSDSLFTDDETCYNEVSEKDLKRLLQETHQNVGYYHQGSANYYEALGRLYLDTEDYDKALTCFLNARRILLHLYSNRHPAMAYNALDLGTTYHELKALNTSKFYLLNALDILNKSGKASISSASGIYIELAKVYTGLRQFERARLSCYKSMRIEEALKKKNPSGKAAAYSCLADIDAAQLKYERALKNYTIANQLYKNIFHQKNGYCSDIFLKLSRLQLERSNYSSALQYADSAIDHCKSSNAINNCYDHWMASLQHLKCQYFANRNADMHFLAKLQHTARIANKTELALSGQKTKFIFREKLAELNTLGIGACASLAEKKQDTAIFKYVHFFIENNKANVLRLQLQHIDARKFLPVAVAQKEKKLTANILRLSFQLNLYRVLNPSGNLESPGKELWIALQEYDAFSKNIAKKYPKYAKLLSNSEPVSLYPLQASLQPTQCLLNYVYANKKYYLMKTDKSEITFSELTSAFNIDSLLMEYKHSILNKKPNRQAGHLLYRALLPANLSKKYTELIISPDGPLHQVPFEIFLTDTTRSRFSYLLEAYAICYTPSATIYSSGKDNENIKSGLLVIAPDYTGSRLDNLPFARKEANTIMSIVNGSKIFPGWVTDKDNFVQKAPAYGFLHIAAHAMVNDNDPNRSYIYFCKDQQLDSLSVSDIYTLPLQARLAVLSSCQTASGVIQPGEGILSLSRAFHYAGVKNMVAASWDAPDKSTALIIQYFYENIKAGKPKSEALRSAKLRYIKQTDPVGAQPYFWAGLILYGDQTPVVFSQINIFTYLLMICTLFLTVGLIYWSFQNKANIK